MLSGHSLTFFLIKIFFPPKSKEQIEVMGSNIVSATFFFFLQRNTIFAMAIPTYPVEKHPMMVNQSYLGLKFQVYLWIVNPIILVSIINFFSM